MRLNLALVLLLAVSPIALAQAPSQQQSLPNPTPPQPAQSQVASAAPRLTPIDFMRKCVVYVEVTGAGNPAPVTTGTAFIVLLPDARFGENKAFEYLVTNRHVAQPGIELGHPHDAVQVLIKSNLASPQAGKRAIIERLPLGGITRWYFPQDDSVDLAVVPVTIDTNRYDLVPISTTTFATEEPMHDLAIGPGDSVFFTGLFTSVPGQERVQPIVRQGILAMMPDEPIVTTLNKPGRLYLADAHAFHGNSGSPIFVDTGGHSAAPVTTPIYTIPIYMMVRYLLLGVVSGYYPEKEGYIVPAATVLTGEVKDNSGIATVVPADELLKLLDSPDLKALRDQAARSLKKP